MFCLLLADEILSTKLNILLSFWGLSSSINFFAMIFWLRNFVLKYKAHVYDFESKGSFDYYFIFMLPFYSIYVVIKYAYRFVKTMGASKIEVAPMVALCAIIVILTVLATILDNIALVYVAAVLQIGCYINMQVVLNRHYVEPDRRITEDE